MALLGALVGYLAFPPVGFWPLAVVGPALLWAVAARRKPLAASLMGLWYGLGYFLALLYWLVNTITDYGGLPLAISILSYLLLVAYLALYPALAARLMAHAASRGADAALLIAPFAWTGLEWVRARLMSGFGWGDTAQALWRQGWALDLAPRIGASGAALLVHLAASGLAWLLLSLGEKEGRPTLRGLAPSALGILLILTVPLLDDGLNPATEGEKIVIVQGNIDQAHKWEPAQRRETVEIHRRLTLEGVRKLGGADLVVWPETAFPSYFQTPSPLRDLVEETAREAGAPVVFGAPAFENAGGARTHRNSVFAVSGEGELKGRYDKMHLVPFGEYVPLPKLFFFIKRMVYAAGDFTPGERTVLLDPASGALPVGALVCFESIFPDYALEHAVGGARILALVTNDAWFGLTHAPWQHLCYAAWRAAETGLPLVRAANTGVSAFFDRRGRLLEVSTQAVETTLTATIQCPKPGKPLAASIQQLIGPCSIALALAGLFAIFALPARKPATDGSR